MEEQYITHAEILVNAPKEKVWEALVRPDRVKRWLHGTEVSTDWKPGSAITYKGEWKGRAYEDKGKVIEAKRGERLMTTFWSSLAGLPDRPENYKRVIYSLQGPEGGPVRLILTQDNNKSPEEASANGENWKGALARLKDSVEEDIQAPILGSGLGL
jgi:uncharacterized protein YndB with AHSA1/START domain